MAAYFEADSTRGVEIPAEPAEKEKPPIEGSNWKSEVGITSIH